MERPSNIDMKLPIVAALVFLTSLALVRADQTIERAQQTLKDQGFYYGEITGDKNADTTAAIRRYQIRNGLQVTGELNEETLRLLQSVSPPSSPAIAKASPSATADTSDLRANSSRETVVPSKPVPEDSFSVPPQDRQFVRPNSGVVVSGTSRFLAGTPYETAPPEAQRDVVISAQTTLTRRGLYHGQVDGLNSPDLEFSLRAYQSRVGIPVTGRLDLETLAALELLPGANAPVYTPRRRVWRERPVRGDWIRE
jgi:peptidoglycan hydrolase-like protein with peptidoglycan-binding domain